MHRPDHSRRRSNSQRNKSSKRLEQPTVPRLVVLRVIARIENTEVRCLRAKIRSKRPENADDGMDEEEEGEENDDGDMEEE